MQGSSQGTDPEGVTILSRARLDGYRLDTRGNSDRELLGRYLYNAAISEALYPLLHTLEIVLRNRINEAATEANPVKSDLPETYNEFPCWIDAVRSPVIAAHEPTVQEAKLGVFRDLRRRYGPLKASARYMWTPGRLVSKLPFSFWVFLFDSDYVGLNRQPGRLWPQLFGNVFPHHAGRATLTEVRKRLRRILVIRNRIMHYERIIPYNNEDGALNPAAVRRDSLELIEWMAPRASSAVKSLDRLPEIANDSFRRYLRITAWRL
jgi:hypothetical protein